jgi:hypothetical protein
LPASSNELWVLVVAFLVDLPAEFGGLFGQVEQRRDLGARKPFDSKQMSVWKGEGVGFGR